jgi:hypothetical protein
MGQRSAGLVHQSYPHEEGARHLPGRRWRHLWRSSRSVSGYRPSRSRVLRLAMVTRGSARRVSCFSFALMLMISAPAPASAQRTVELAVGARIRVRSEADSVWRIGRLAATLPDTIRFQPCETCAVAAYPLSTTAVEVSSIPRSQTSTVLEGAGLGFLLGAGAGGLLAYQSNRNCHDGPCGLAYVAVPIGGFVGLFLGAAAGSLIRNEEWHPAPLR